MKLEHLAFPIASVLIVLGLWFTPSSFAQTAPANAPITQLTDAQAASLRPVWSPDNRLIAYQSNREGGTHHIYVMNADGSNVRALTRGNTDNRHPVWMPDGTSLLFDSFDGKQREIWQVTLNGELKQLTHLGALANFPAPSPNGQEMTFYVFANETLDLWRARIDGTDAQPLTRALATTQNNQCTFACHRAAWSPDGRTIAYSAGELDTIWLIAREGGTPQAVVADGADNHFPWFLPDGRLGFVTEHIQPNNAWTDVWALDLKTGQRALLQGRMALQGPVEWSNDHRQVLFHSPRSGRFQIYRIDLNEPRGVDALRGTPIAPQVIATPANTSPPASVTTSAHSLIETNVILGIGGLIIAGITGIIGVFIWRKLR